MLDGWENGEADGGCREFGLLGVKGVGRLWVILHNLIVLGYFFLQPHSARGSLGKESTHWNGREVNRWISCDWELIDIHGNLTKFVVRQPQKEQACTRKLKFLWIFNLDMYFHFIMDLDLHFIMRSRFRICFIFLGVAQSWRIHYMMVFLWEIDLYFYLCACLVAGFRFLWVIPICNK